MVDVRQTGPTSRVTRQRPRERIARVGRRVGLATVWGVSGLPQLGPTPHRHTPLISEEPVLVSRRGFITMNWRCRPTHLLPGHHRTHRRHHLKPG
jgi:hypothetical protein